jgi:hypothetical protein
MLGSFNITRKGKMKTHKERQQPVDLTNMTVHQVTYRSQAILHSQEAGRYSSQ